MTKRNSYRVYDDGEIVRLTENDLVIYAFEITGEQLEDAKKAKEVIENSGSPLASLICFSYAEARNLSERIKELK